MRHSLSAMTHDEIIQYKRKCQRIHEALNREITSGSTLLPRKLVLLERRIGARLHDIYLELERRATAAKIVAPTSYEQWLSSSL